MKRIVGTTAATLAALATIGFGTASAQAGPPPIAPPAPGQAGPGANCGFVTTAAHRQEMIIVEAGTVFCPRVRDVYNQYFRALAAGRGPGAGAGPIQIDEWTCSTNQDIMAPFNRCDSKFGQRTIGQFGP
ncbi:MAG: hypothetical protein J2P18_08575 [Nocardia sp.]|nr:hypothetical protein [Nocardia sp.]